MEEVIIVGAGPCGMSAAIECKLRGIEPLLIEKYHLCSSIYRYPTYMVFHSTPELLEIGNIPFTTPNEKPTRQEGLVYYRKVADYYNLRIESPSTVTSIKRQGDAFLLEAEGPLAIKKTLEAKRVIVATGYFERPNRLGIKGEDLSKVSNYFTEGHPYYNKHVTVIGGRNNAVEAAMDLYRAGAHVSVVYRNSSLSEKVKAWLRPVFESAVDKGWIDMHWNSRVIEIKADSIVVESIDGNTKELPNDAVFSLIGYKPHHELLHMAGVRFDQESGKPVFHDQTMETNVPGLYVAGVSAGGSSSNEIFIENGRFHGISIAEHLKEMR